MVNFSEVVVHHPEYLVLHPGASWRFLKIWWVGALRHNATEVYACIQNVSLRPRRPRRQMHRMPRTQLIIFADVQHKNGVSERMIRTITTKAGELLLDARLPAEFWAEAIQTAVYLHARLPSQSNKGKTPFEMIYHEKPELHHLQRFGCLAYKLVPVPQRGEKKFC